MKRLLDAQRVQVQPNKTGTSVMLGGSVYLNNRRQRVVFSETPGTPYNDLHHTREFANAKDTTQDNERKCVVLQYMQKIAKVILYLTNKTFLYLLT